MKYPESYSINTDTEHGYYAMSTSLKTEKLTNVSMDRNYLALQISSDHMFVFSEKIKSCILQSMILTVI